MSAHGVQRVLLVEDNDDDATLVARALGRSAHAWAIEVVHGLADAWRRLGEEPRPDVVLLDVGLGPDDGLDLLARIRGHAFLGGVPVVVLSGNRDPQVRRRARELGASSFILKPYHAAEYDLVAPSLHQAIG